jgi:hypothetical protein
MSDTEFMGFPKMGRLSRECWVTEKIDGTNAQIYITDDGQMLIGSRTRWITPESDNFGFARWATEHKDELLQLGPGRHFGEWWGCLDAETSVKLADGSIKRIGVIVNNKLDVEVMSYNFKSKQFEPKKVVGWKRGPSTNDWISMGYKRKHRGGRGVVVTLTPNHVVFTRRDGNVVELPASDLQVGDTVFLPGESIGHYQREMIRGSVLGDGSISDHSFHAGHSNHAYANTKARILGSCLSGVSEATSGKGSKMLVVHSKSLAAVREIEEEIYREGAKHPTEDYIMSLGPVALAFWYMDDGCLNTQEVRSPCSSLYIQGFDSDTVSVISITLNRRGYENYIISAGGGCGKAIRFTPNGTLRLHTDISPFVPPEMQYKLIQEFRSQANFWNSVEPSPSDLFGLVESEITCLKPGTPRSKVRYDIEVEDNHNFIANGVLVHNSGIQRGYGLPKGEKRFSLFNVSRWCLAGQTPSRIPTGDPRIEKYQDVLPACCHLVPVLYRGVFDTAFIEGALTLLGAKGSFAAPGFMNPEGIIVFHTAANIGFKKTLGDDGHKGQ